MKKLLSLFLIVASLALVVGACSSPADVASSNLSSKADNFEIQRRIVFFNGITDKYLLTIEGRCSLGNNDQPKELSVTCKVGPNTFKKEFLGLSDNVSYFVEQLEPVSVSTYRYRVYFRPTEIAPDVTSP